MWTNRVGINEKLIEAEDWDALGKRLLKINIELISMYIESNILYRRIRSRTNNQYGVKECLLQRFRLRKRSLSAQIAAFF